MIDTGGLILSQQFYKSLSLIQKMFPISNIELETFNQKYEAFNFNLEGLSFKSRLAKKTPLKHGYFVTFWQKNNINNNEPFNQQNTKDKLVITVLDGLRSGQFIFPKKVLIEQNILKTETSKGKMALLVYPSWVNNLNKAAERTQRWQLQYFVDLSSTKNQQEINNLFFGGI
ncbi:hypothetical protein FC19_GL000551 [Liquorilactobacillus aquaticus DSM 21051]|uniref:MepB protein n=1 Tax=Liquorilactobacillus aquaticus DSM 21051 TaxID=1423725 RepID=A0A0R2CWK7_9LACO|nr:hypothetical protein FC19_GL000551 [Liquorilactobacillus aquaticus DSM 21051]